MLTEQYIQDISEQIYDYIIKQLKNIDEIPQFQIHISLPMLLMIRHHYFAKLFEQTPEQILTVKDILRTFLITKIETLLNAKNVIDSNNIIELNFTHDKSKFECDSFMNTYKEMFGDKKCKYSSSTQPIINQKSLVRIFEHLNLNDLDRFVLTKIDTVCKLELFIKKEPLFIAGRYLKFSRTLSQTPWIINDNQFISSVQERIISGIRQYIKFDDIKFSASGREDVDVRMLGKGRPFLMELIHPQWSVPENAIDQIKQFINQKYQDVSVRDLQIVPKYQSQILLKEGEQEKSKTYQALCCLDRPFTTDDANKLNSIENLIICQKTPIRVLHRRTLADRKRTIYSIKIMEINPDDLSEELRPHISNLFQISIITQAGTYIKEFVHSDFGRTSPSIADLLGNCTTDIINLDVMEVKLDWPPSID